MAELVDSRRRSEVMAGIKTPDSNSWSAEPQTSRIFAFVSTGRGFPATPILPRYRLAVFVHGRLWPHRTDANLLNRSVAAINMPLP